MKSSENKLLKSSCEFSFSYNSICLYFLGFSYFKLAVSVLVFCFRTFWSKIIIHYFLFSFRCIAGLQHFISATQRNQQQKHWSPKEYKQGERERAKIPLQVPKCLWAVLLLELAVYPLPEAYQECYNSSSNGYEIRICCRCCSSGSRARAGVIPCSTHREMCNSWLLIITITLECLWNSQLSATSKSCPAECICLSQTQVSEGLTRA